MAGEIYKKPIMFSIVAAAVILIGTFVTMFYPMLTPGMHPRLENLRQYSPLELAGKDVYQREGCVNCHTQTVRPLRTEVMRYGEFSKAGEFAYDRPFLWGSKRTGPDLARIGIRWPVAKLHYDHFINPQAFVQKSNMPAYGWLKDFPLTPSSVKAHMDAQGFSYSDKEINELEGKNDLDALVAYMLWLGHAVKMSAPVRDDVSGLHGAAVYASSCAGCHADDATGGFGPDLTDNIWLGKEGDISDERLLAILTQGTDNGMPPFGGAIPDEELGDVVVYLRSLGPMSSSVVSDDPVASAYAENCAGCHSGDGSGGFGPALVDNVWLGKEGAISDEDMLLIITKGTGKGMPPFEGAIPQEVLSGMVAHIRQLGSSPPHDHDDHEGAGGEDVASLFAYNCGSCHADDGSGGFGPDLTDNVWLGLEGDISDERLVEIIRDGTSNGMPAHEGYLREPQIRDISGYVRSLAR